MRSVILSGKSDGSRTRAKNLNASWRVRLLEERPFASLRVTKCPDEVHRMVVAWRIPRVFKEGATWDFE